MCSIPKALAKCKVSQGPELVFWALWLLNCNIQMAQFPHVQVLTEPAIPVEHVNLWSIGLGHLLTYVIWLLSKATNHWLHGTSLMMMAVSTFSSSTHLSRQVRKERRTRTSQYWARICLVDWVRPLLVACLINTPRCRDMSDSLTFSLSCCPFLNVFLAEENVCQAICPFRLTSESATRLDFWSSWSGCCKSQTWLFHLSHVQRWNFRRLKKDQQEQFAPYVILVIVSFAMAGF